MSRKKRNNTDRNSNQKNKFVGTLEVSTRGVAIVICQGIEDKILIENIGQYLHNDIVEIYVFTRKKKDKYLGEITSLIKREKTEYVGKIQISENFSFVLIDNKRIHVDVFVPIDKTTQKVS